MTMTDASLRTIDSRSFIHEPFDRYDIGKPVDVKRKNVRHDGV